jgi:hypothetical protein
MKLMNKISSLGISAAIITGLLIFAATNPVLAVPAMPSKQTNQQMISLLFGGKNVNSATRALFSPLPGEIYP